MSLHHVGPKEYELGQQKVMNQCYQIKKYYMVTKIYGDLKTGNQILSQHFLLLANQLVFMKSI